MIGLLVSIPSREVLIFKLKSSTHLTGEAKAREVLMKDMGKFVFSEVGIESSISLGGGANLGEVGMNFTGARGCENAHAPIRGFKAIDMG
jgi:hypothetical protein